MWKRLILVVLVLGPLGGCQTPPPRTETVLNVSSFDRAATEIAV